MKELKNSIIVFTFFTILLFLFSNISAQRKRMDGSDIHSLDKKQRLLEREVKKTEEFLEQTRKIKKKSYNELTLLKQQIALREELLGGLSRQISDIDLEIMRMDVMMATMEQDIKVFQKSYAEAAKRTYIRQGSLSILIWALSSNSFNQAFDRIVYFTEYGKYRKNQIFIIKRTKEYLLKKKEDKENKKREKQLLISKRFEEKYKLDKAREEKDKLFNELKLSENKFQQKLKQYREDLATIREEIKRLVMESRLTAGKNETIELDKVSSTFNLNRGKLPWPVPMYEGIITGTFGRTTASTGGEIINEGIYISTKQEQTVRSVFNGTVTLVGKVPSYGKVVIVQHGKYRTVYANLENVYVNKGDDVNILQPIGTVKTNNNTGETQLYFQIYRDFNAVNPILWISRKE